MDQSFVGPCNFGPLVIVLERSGSTQNECECRGLLASDVGLLWPTRQFLSLVPFMTGASHRM